MDQQQQADMYGSLRYALSQPAAHHEGYDRLLLEEVSRELLHIHDAQDAEEDIPQGQAEGVCVAVAFRKSGCRG